LYPNKPRCNLFENNLNKNSFNLFLKRENDKEREGGRERVREKQTEK
jgi:hypothetical protein